MKRFFIVLALLSLTLFSSRAQKDYVPAPENLAARAAFSADRFGIFIHWGIYSMLGNGEWVMERQEIPAAEYEHLAAGFNPSRFDADAWVKAFKDAGAKYITFTSRHHDGFSMFHTRQSKYNIVDATPFKRDVLKELSEACARHGLRLHLYYSHLDWWRTDYWPLVRTGHFSGRPEGDASSWGHYLKFIDAQLTELLTNYGPIGAIWFDGVWDKKALFDKQKPEDIWNLYGQYALIHKLQPACLVADNHHLPYISGEDFQIVERDLPGKMKQGFNEGQTLSDDLPLERCETTNRSWGYNFSDTRFKSGAELVRMLAETASIGANLLLNVGPRPDGTIPERSLEGLRVVGAWLGVNGESIYGTLRGSVPEQSWGVTTQKGSVLYAHVLNPAALVFIPFSGNKLLAASMLDDGTKVAYTQVKEGIILTLPASALDTDAPHHVVKLRFKDAL